MLTIISKKTQDPLNVMVDGEWWILFANGDCRKLLNLEIMPVEIGPYCWAFFYC